MGYTHYWRQFRPFTSKEWTTITSEAKRICAKAQRGEYYTGKEDFASATRLELGEGGFRVGFNEEYAWRTFPHPESHPPMQGAQIALADGSGEVGTSPEFTDTVICLNGVAPADYETFALEKAPECPKHQREDYAKGEGIFACCKTEYRAYDAVVVSILFMAQSIAGEAITVSSDGGNDAIKLMF